MTKIWAGDLLNTSDFYTQIRKLINPIVTAYKNYYPEKLETKDGKKIYPYATMQITNVLPNNEYSNNNLLLIDIWDDKSDDFTEIDNVTDEIFEALNEQKNLIDNILIEIYRNSPCIISLPDPDANIQRKQVKMICKVF